MTTTTMMMISGTHGDIKPYDTISADHTGIINPCGTISAGPTMAQRPQRPLEAVWLWCQGGLRDRDRIAWQAASAQYNLRTQYRLGAAIKK